MQRLAQKWGFDIEQTHATVRNILTLRYDPAGPTVLPKLSWRDFVEYEGVSGIIESMLLNVLKRLVHNRSRIAMGISGGVDTSTILALLRRTFPDLSIHTCCLSFGKDDKECGDASHVADLYGTKHEHVVIEDPFGSLPEQIRILREPRWNLYTAFLFEKVASDGHDLLLTGDGADELFGGYSFRYERALQSEEFDAMDYLAAHERDWVPDQTELIPDLRWNEVCGYLDEYLSAPLPRLGCIFLADFNGKLLHDFMSSAVAFSHHYRVRAESPFLQPEIIYTASHLPYRLKYDAVNKVGKLLLRSILLSNSGIQMAVKGKVGFGMDLAWMWDHHIREMCESHLLEKSHLGLVGINTEWLPKGFKKADEHDLRYISKMLGLLAVEVWLRQQ